MSNVPRGLGPRRGRLRLRFTGGTVIIHGELTQYNTFPYGSVIHLFFVEPKTTTTVISCIFDDMVFLPPLRTRGPSDSQTLSVPQKGNDDTLTVITATNIF